MLAYDLETTRIEAGTPQIRYISIVGHSPEALAVDDSLLHPDLYHGRALSDLDSLGDYLSRTVINENFTGYSLVAWNGNNFDAYLVACALLFTGRYNLVPYLTRGNSLRGLKVTPKEELVKSGELKDFTIEILDAMAMTVGNAPMTLHQFTQVFAPDYVKIKDAINWDVEEFDARNTKHVEYSMRDSEGLYHGMRKANAILNNYFHLNFKVTIGATAIRVFQSQMPEHKTVYRIAKELEAELRLSLLRGGYCYMHRAYKGPVWKYDLNQAYCAAMREVDLPAGSFYEMTTISKYAKCFVVLCDLEHKSNTIPFYAKTLLGASVFVTTAIQRVWITSDEYRQLQKERWRITVHRCVAFEDQFRMPDFVNSLEELRVRAPDGPKGAQGMIMKAIGNNAYGKTVEVLEGVDSLMSMECPGEGWYESVGCEEDTGTSYIWHRQSQRDPVKDYHCMQIGAFITAHVRMQVRRAALLAPSSFLYADTDCVVFDAPVKLDIDPARYGAWKQETDGENYVIVTKKVYASYDGTTKHAKGMNRKLLEVDDFFQWADGSPPVREQIQRASFLKVVKGRPMYKKITKTGQRL